MSSFGESPPLSDDEEFPPPDEDFDDDFPPPDEEELPDDYDPEEMEFPDDEHGDEDFMPPDDDEENPPSLGEDEFNDMDDMEEGSLPPDEDFDESDLPPDEEDEVPLPDHDEEDPTFEEDSFPVESLHDSVTDSKRSSSVGDRESSFLLPVAPPTMTNKERSLVSDDIDEFPVPLNLDSLTVGLTIKEPPKILKKSVKIVDQTPVVAYTDNNNGSFVSVSNDPSLRVLRDNGDGGQLLGEGTVNIIPSSAPTVVTTDAQQTLEEKGFVFGLGKYEGDPFEPMFLQAHKSRKQLEVILETGECMTFDLSIKAYVFEDTVDSNTIVLDYHRSVIVFKFSTSDQLIAFMKNMPEEVFFAPDAINGDDDESIAVVEEPIMKEAPVKKPISKPAPPKPVPIGPGPKIEHVKGTSVEDILENDFETNTERQEKIEQMFQVKDTVPVVPQPPRRKELIESYIRKPKYSVRRVTLLCEWVNSMHIWPNKLTITTLHKEMCNGLLLANLVKKLNPDVQFVHLNEKPLAKKAALENLEQALGHVWRSKSLNNSRIPTALDIYGGNTAKTAVLLNELYGVYVLKPLYKNAIKMLKWYHYVLRQYQRALPDYIFDDGDLSGVWPHFQSGTALFCVMYHFFGQTQIGSGSNAQRIDPLRMVGDPTSICDFRENLTYVFHLLRLLGVDILWTAEDWISNPDTEFILLQLQYIYDFLRFKQCTLPPAQGDKPGLTSGPNGEALVVGLIFSDAPSSLRFIPKTQKAVRLGHDKDSMPLLPVDRMVKNPRFVSHGVLPLGMLSNYNVKIVEVKSEFIGLPTLDDRGDWNSRTTVKTEKENYAGQHLVSILREHHKQAESFSPTRIARQSTVKRDQTYHVASGFSGLSDSQSSDGNALSTHDQVSREINDMVRNLEEEMMKAQDKISSFEESLAGKYGDLESKIDETPLDEYESRLLDLEDERMRLEQEKQNLQDYFARKLALIRARKDEIQQMHFAKQQAVFSSMLNVAHGAGQPKPRDNMLKTNKAAVTPKDIAAAEKGWINLSARMETHNFHLRSKQAVACAAFQAKITPKALRGRTISSSFQNFTDGQYQTNAEIGELSNSNYNFSTLNNGQLTSNSSENSVRDSFMKFKIRLKIASDKWLQSKIPKDRQSIAETIANSKPPQIELISLPTKPDSIGQTYAEEVKYEHTVHFSPSLRYEELQVMFYEDERRRMVIAEEAFEKSVQMSQHLFAFDGSRTNEQHPPESASGDVLLNELQLALQKYKVAPPTVEDVETALHYLSTERLIVVNERSAKEYIFSLVAVTDRNEDKYALEWKDVPIYSNEEHMAGILLLDDIVDVDIHIMETLVLMVYIKESPRAVKNSKGRTVLALKFPSNSDCLAYCLHLSCLRSIA